MSWCEAVPVLVCVCAVSGHVAPACLLSSVQLPACTAATSRYQSANPGDRVRQRVTGTLQAVEV